MHEMGTILHIIDSTEKLCAKHGVSRLGYVRIEVGDLADAMPQYLLSLWPMGAKDTICEGADLLIDHKISHAKCDKCGETYEVKKNLANDNLPRCPNCGFHRYKILDGSKIVITELGAE